MRKTNAQFPKLTVLMIFIHFDLRRKIQFISCLAEQKHLF